MLNPVAMSIIRNVFEDPRERAQAIGVWGGVIGLSMALGPVVGGALVDSVGWPAVFLVNVPVGLAAIVLTALFVPESRAPHARRFDPIGQLLVIVALSTLTYAIIEGPGNGWLSAQTLILFAVSLRRVHVPGRLRAAPRPAADRDPLLPQRAVLGRQRDRCLRVRGPRRVSVPQHPVPPGGPRAVAASRRPVHAAAGADDARDRAAVGASGRQPRRRPSLRRPEPRSDRQRADPDAADARRRRSGSAARQLRRCSGSASGSINPPITNTAVSGMPPSQAGVAAAVASTSRQVGVTLGVAVLGALAGGAAAGAIGVCVRRGHPRQLVDHGRTRGRGARARLRRQRASGRSRPPAVPRIGSASSPRRRAAVRSGAAGPPRARGRPVERRYARNDGERASAGKNSERPSELPERPVDRRPGIRGALSPGHRERSRHRAVRQGRHGLPLESALAPLRGVPGGRPRRSQLSAGLG